MTRDRALAAIHAGLRHRRNRQPDTRPRDEAGRWYSRSMLEPIPGDLAWLCPCGRVVGAGVMAWLLPDGRQRCGNCVNPPEEREP